MWVVVYTLSILYTGFVSGGGGVISVVMYFIVLLSERKALSLFGIQTHQCQGWAKTLYILAAIFLIDPFNFGHFRRK